MKKSFVLFSLILLPLAAWAQSAEEDFFGEDAVTVTAAPVSTADPTKQFSEDATGVRWGGTVKADSTWQPGWVGGWPGEASAQWKDGLAYDLSTILFVDSRPDKDFRFRLSLQTGYPFTKDTKNVALDPAALPAKSTTVSTPNIKVWEMFTDVTIADAVFLRFGKQSASWGVSYFYSPGDVISLTAKDATDPTAQREGPVALKATVPFPGLKANLTGFVLARDSYFNSTSLPTLREMGYALQGDILVGDAQLMLGGFYQQDNAPKAVATLNTGFGFLHVPGLSDVNLFSEAVFSYGSDVLKGEGERTITVGTTSLPTFARVTSWEKTIYYTGTVGASYSNDDANLTLRTEYLYNPFGYSDKRSVLLAYNTVLASTADVYTSGGGINSGRVYGFGDAATPGMHNLSTLLSLAKLGGVDRLSFSTLWQQNLSDFSGWVKPMFSLDPWDQLTFSWGLSVVYGDEGTQYPLTFQYRNAQGGAEGTQRVTLNIGVTYGTGKY